MLDPLPYEDNDHIPSIGVISNSADDKEDSLFAQPEFSNASDPNNYQIWTKDSRHPNCCTNHYLEFIYKPTNMETPTSDDLMIRRLSLYFEKYPPHSIHHSDKDATMDFDDEDNVESSLTNLSYISVSELSSNENKVDECELKSYKNTDDQVEVDMSPLTPERHYNLNNTVYDQKAESASETMGTTEDEIEKCEPYTHSTLLYAPDVISTLSSELSRSERNDIKLNNSKMMSNYARSNYTSNPDYLEQGDHEPITQIRYNWSEKTTDSHSDQCKIKTRPPSPSIAGNKKIQPPKPRSLGRGIQNKQKSAQTTFSSGSESSHQPRNTNDYSEISSHSSKRENSQTSSINRSIGKKVAFASHSEQSSQGSTTARSRSQIIEDCVRRLTQHSNSSYDSLSRGMGDVPSLTPSCSMSSRPSSRQGRSCNTRPLEDSLTAPTCTTSTTFDKTAGNQNSRKPRNQSRCSSRSNTPRSASCTRRNTSSLQDSSFSSDTAIRQSRFLDTTRSNSRWSEISVSCNSLNGDIDNSRRSGTSSFYTACSTMCSRQRSRSFSSCSQNGDKRSPIGQKFWIPDVEAVKASMLERSDRRLALILNKHDCSAELIQATNRQRGYPHSIVYLRAPSKDQLKWLARDLDRIYPKWNVSSQLRSIR